MTRSSRFLKSTLLPRIADRPQPSASERSLPKLTFSEDLASKLADCPICLSKFVAGDEIRVLPQCCHAFHVVCVDTWLGSHSSFPSCRQILAGWFPVIFPNLASNVFVFVTEAAGAKEENEERKEK